MVLIGVGLMLKLLLLCFGYVGSLGSSWRFFVRVKRFGGVCFRGWVLSWEAVGVCFGRFSLGPHFVRLAFCMPQDACEIHNMTEKGASAHIFKPQGV